MKLAIIRKRYSAYGGAERFIDGLSRALKERGDSITMIAESWQSGYVDLQFMAASAKGLTRSQRNKTFQNAVRELLKTKHFDLVQTHERIVGADICRLGDGLHKAWLSRYQSTLPSWRRHLMNFDPFHQQILKLEYEMINNSQTHIVVNSQLIKDELLHLYKPSPERVSLISNGVDTSFFIPASEELRSKARLQFNLKKEDFVIAFVGSGYRRKGAFQLIDAVARTPDVKLLIAGKDKEGTHLHRRIEELQVYGSVFPLGPVLDVRPIYWAADLFVLPSLYDPSSNAVLEALACGLPVITTADVGMAADIQKRKAGAICMREAGSIARTLIEAKGQVAEMQINARKLAEDFSQDKIVSLWCDLYNKLSNLKN